RIVGYFSKTNPPPDGNNLACILLLADSFYNGIDRPLNQQLGQQSYLFGQSTVQLPPWGQQLGSTLVLAGHPHSQPVGGSYDSRLALLVPGEPGEKSTTDPATTRLIDDLANIKALPLYSIVVQNCISMGNPYCTKDKLLPMIKTTFLGDRAINVPHMGFRPLPQRSRVHPVSWNRDLLYN
ncbi:hypothetical protein T492DRAFT_890549, partial [Pavlovales sp. CCMP2436]